MSNKPFSLPGSQDFQKNPELFTKEVAFQGIALTAFSNTNSSLIEFFKNQGVELTLHGARRFRAVTPRTGFGLMPFEGCSVVIFTQDASQRADLFFNQSTASGVKVVEVEGSKVLMFQEKPPYSDPWTTFVTFSEPNALLVCTNLDYLREVLSRLHGKSGPRALPETLPEWRYLDTSAQFWALRHYGRAEADEDPSSPIGNREMGKHYSDKQAIGLVFSFDSASGKGPLVTYLSANSGISSEPTRSMLSMGYEGQKLGITYRELSPGVLEASYDLEAPGAVFTFSFYLGWMLGHGIFL